MKRSLLTLAIISITLLCQDCSSNNNDEYYVKYSINSTTIQIGGKLDLFITDEDGIQTEFLVNQREPSEFIIGPVDINFNADMLARDAGSAFGLKLYANIYVSKNGSPFALKATNESEQVRNFVSLSYTIDY